MRFYVSLQIYLHKFRQTQMKTQTRTRIHTTKHAHKCAPHRYIMTSLKALELTKAFLADNAYFGLHASQVSDTHIAAVCAVLCVVSLPFCADVFSLSCVQTFSPSVQFYYVIAYCLLTLSLAAQVHVFAADVSPPTLTEDLKVVMSTAKPGRMARTATSSGMFFHKMLLF